LIPVEVWELAHRPNLGKAAVTIGNIVIVVYLVWHVRSKGRRPGAPTPAGAVGGGATQNRGPH
jgi:hypothetical protein